MAYDRTAILEAWKKASSRGIVDTSVVRPEIARSWLRCLSIGVNPWDSSFPQRDEQLLVDAQKKHAALIEAAQSVLQYLLTIFGCNCSLADMRGFVFLLQTPLTAYPRTLGTFVTEETSGNGNITVAIYEHKPCRVDGYEHFRAISQNYSGVAAPFHTPAGEEFVLCMNDPFTVLPANALEVCVAAVHLIEQLCGSRREVFSHLSSATFFDPLIESDALAVIVTDCDGMILTANAKGKQAVTGFENSPYCSRSLGEFLKNKQILPRLLQDGEFDKEEEILFRSGRNRSVSMKLLRRSTFRLINGTQHHVMVFQLTNAPEPDTGREPLLKDNSTSSDYIGKSPQWRKVDQLIQSVAMHKANVMIMGETGTGKEVVARVLHRKSGRKGEFVAINCGAMPRDLLASELFGYEGGAFTGARASGAKGKFEYANGGTLFLDEIGDMPFDMQVSLLRVLQEQSVMRIGSSKAIPINVRVIAATNQDLPKLIREGKFRADLWYRLSVIEIKLPCLADRDGDIRLMADYFNESLSQSLNLTCYPLPENVHELLETYSWPGNVRELKNAMEKALILANGRPVIPENFPEYILGESDPKKAELEKAVIPSYTNTEESFYTGKQLREQQEKERIIRVLDEEQGNISRSAKRLNISRNTLYRKIEKIGIQIKVSATTDKQE